HRPGWERSRSACPRSSTILAATIVRARLPAMSRRRRCAAWSAPTLLFSEEPTKAPVEFPRSVTERAEVDFGATLVQLQIAVRRIVEQDRRALDKSIIKGSLQIDLLVQEIGIERRHHLERAVHSLAADDPGARIDQQVGFQRFDIDRTVAEKVLNRHGGHDLVRSCGRDPSQRLVKGADQRLYRPRVRGNELLPGI